MINLGKCRRCEILDHYGSGPDDLALVESLDAGKVFPGHQQNDRCPKGRLVKPARDRTDQ